MIQKQDHSGHRRARRFELLPASDHAGVAHFVTELAPARVGLTGGGAKQLAARLDLPVRRVDEFAGAMGALELA